MALPTEDSLIAVELVLPLPNYLTVFAYQRQLRFLLDLVVILTPPEAEIMHEDRGDVDYFRGSEGMLPLRPGEGFDLDAAREYLQERRRREEVGEPPEPLPGILVEPDAASSTDEIIEIYREPTYRQLLARRRGRVQRDIDVCEVRYGSHLSAVVQTEMVPVAIALFIITVLYVMVSNARRIASSNNTAINRNRLQDEMIDYISTELPHMQGPDADPGMRQVVDLMLRLDEGRMTKEPTAELLPKLPQLPPSIQLPGLAKLPQLEPGD